MLYNPIHHLLGMKENPFPADLVIHRRKFRFFLGISVLQCLVIKEKYISFSKETEMKNKCALSIVNEDLECVANSSHHLVKEGGPL